MSLRRFSSVIFIILLILFAITGCGGSHNTVKLSLPGHIAFYSENDEIYMIDANGSSLSRLTNTRYQDWFPACSPDGTFIAFQGENRDQYGDIYRIRPNGYRQKLLTPNTYQIDDTNPAVSPDSKRIAFVSDRNGQPNIYTMNASDGSNVLQLTTDAGADVQPAYTPDGRIVYYAKRDSDSGFFIMHADGSNQQRLTTSTANDEYPAVSPLGDRIAFDSNRSGSYRIYTMRLDGGDVQQLSDISGTHPTYSPDGQWIAFSSNGNIVALPVYGGKLVYITLGNGTNLAPSWGM